NFHTPTSFDNCYFGNLVSNCKLLHSDQQLFSDGGSTDSIVRSYSGDEVQQQDGVDYLLGRVRGRA
ncbi:Peroxidase 70, partial [Linum perenne]